MSKIPLTSFDSTLECMEDQDFESHVSRTKYYFDIINSFHAIGNLTTNTAERLLAVCLQDLTTDFKRSGDALSLITLIVEDVKNGAFEPMPKLLPSALAIIKLTKKSLIMNIVQLKNLCLNTLLSYPDETLIELVTFHSKEVLETFDCTLEKVRVNLGNLPSLLVKFLTILPPEKKQKFIKDGVDSWFRAILPCLIRVGTQDLDSLQEVIPCLEILTECLVEIDYSKNKHWENFAKSLSDPKRYPKFLKCLVETGNEHWNKLWVIFIKLLKGEITKVNKTGISPINALLPVIELAFKLDTACRCKAFQCWNILIDNFSSNVGEAREVNKRLKLLTIPLKLNNTKVEETVLAKFNTWWHMIRQFHSKIDKFTDIVLIPFLHFCFGKHDSKTVGFGQISKLVSRQCVEALEEITGHVNCEGSVTIPRLSGKLISVKMLVDHWSDWVHSLRVAIKSHYSGSHIANQQVMCLWTSFFVTISELPDNRIRADLVNELLKIMEDLVKDSSATFNTRTTVFCLLLKALLNDPTVCQLLKTKTKDGPLYVILSIITDKSLGEFYARLDSQTIMATMKPLTNLIMTPTAVQSDEIVEMIIQTMPCHENYIELWISMAESIRDSPFRLNTTNLVNVVLWPFQNMDKFTNKNTELLGYEWFTLYNNVHPMVPNDALDSKITDILHNKGTSSNFYLTLSASLALLKEKLVNSKHIEDQETDLLISVVSKMKSYKEMEMFLPILIDTLVLLLNKANDTNNPVLFNKSVKIIGHIVSLINGGLKVKDMIDTNELNIIDNFLREIDAFLQKDAFVFQSPIIVDTLIESVTLVDKKHKLRANILTILKTLMLKSKETNELVYNKIKPILDIIDSLESTSDSTNENKDKNDNDFPVPEIKAPVNAKKKETRILSTVVDNGEEFVVVKSNWKFNPRKLTEAQKDKLKRKREDIPALYQDLSQSQDEFKLTAWKTDSQDASTTSSKSNSKSANTDVTSILKNMVSTEVVPNIMENILSDASNKVVEKTNEQPSVSIFNKQSSPAARDPKTPRMALKDRVFKNVRNLIEKSGLQTEGKIVNEVVEDLNQTVSENKLKTPVSKEKPTLNVTNSAPPKIVSERPSRSIKKPKKFEDTEIFALKRKRRSQGSSPHLDGEIPEKDQKLTKELEHEKTNKDIVNITVEPAQPEKSLQDVELIKETPINIQKIYDKPEPIVIENSEVFQNVQDNSVVSNVQEENINNEINIANEKMDVQEQIFDAIPKESEVMNSTPDNSSQLIEEIATPKPKKKEDNSTIKKKRSRIEKQLLIDMVEGHPLLSQSEKRVTRKNQAKDNVSKRRKSLIEKSNKIKAELQNAEVGDKANKEKEKISPRSLRQKTLLPQEVNLTDSQESGPESSQDLPMSEDVIESSQDSTLTTISVRSASAKNKVPVVVLSKSNALSPPKDKDTQKLIENCKNDSVAEISGNQVEKEDIELPKNKTMLDDKSVDLTENMDTEPIDSSEDVFIINEDEHQPITIGTEDTVGKETQELAEADTLPMEVESLSLPTAEIEVIDITVNLDKTENKSHNDVDITHVPTQDVTPSIPDTAEAIADVIAESSNTDSPFKDDVQRKKEFLNDTIEISPIKSMSPIREKKTPSPDAKNDFVVIKLTAPVQSNGEPYNEKCDSPEVFTEEKVSPDKRDQSPPRKESSSNTSSPSSSLSLKKNRPQMRFNGRAGQMLGLCIAENDKKAGENVEDRSLASTPARRNLKTMYNSENNQKKNNTDDSEDSVNFLKFKKTLPTAECSPVGPILKRKLADIADDATASPASKRKRVSFHDPPVSTTVAVQKYIEPLGIRSPQHSAIKRQERQARALTHHLKSPKRLDKVFRLDTILTKAVESFSGDTTVNATISLDETPPAEVIKTSELNDKDPICPELVNCTDPIQNIAGDLSSATTKALLIKELEGKIETIADLAKMTELEVNRLCIKTPKIKVARKVLDAYASKKAQDATKTPEEPVIPEPVIERISIEVQTAEVLTTCSEMQTAEVPMSLANTQTDATPMSHCSVQTNESGSKSTEDIIAMCMSERPDFLERLTEQLDDTAIQRISDKLPFNASLDLLLKKMTASNSKELLNRTLAKCSLNSSNENSENLNMFILQDYLCNRFDSQSLILFCSQMLKKVHDKS